MTQKQLQTEMEKGGVFCTGVYWAGKIEPVTYRDKKSGESRTIYIARETVLTDTDTVAVTRFLKDGEQPEAWKPSASKMDKVAVKVTGMQMEKGTVTMNGSVEKLIA